MIWEDIVLATPEMPGSSAVCNFFAAVQDEDEGG
jgi:hypothetical protein